MKIEEQVAPFEQSKKILELGIKIKTHFVWDKPLWNKYWEAIERWMVEDDSEVMIAAPSVAELMFFLPGSIKVGDYIYEFRFEKSSEYCNLCYWCESLTPDNRLLVSINGDIAETLADVLIFLIEKKHLKVEDLKL